MSAGVEGMTTVSPGMWASSASRLWECWLPEERPAPNWVRTVSAISAPPPVMNGSLAAWLSSWSRQTPRKSRYISSTTGRMPAMAAPTAEPDDRRLGDRRVADPLAEPVAQPPGEAEHVATRPDVDAGDEHAVVGLELVLRARRGRRPWSGTPRRPAPAGPVRPRARARARDTKSNEAGGRRGGQAHGPARPRRRAAAATDDSSAVELVLGDAGLDAGARRCTTSGSRPCHARTSSASR